MAEHDAGAGRAVHRPEVGGPPYYSDDWLTVYGGDCRSILAMLPAESVHCVVTSPPYWGLRDYGIPLTSWGGDINHEHVWGEPIIANAASYDVGEKARWNHRENGRGEAQGRILAKEPGWTRKDIVRGAQCSCGAWSGALGLEPTPEQYVENMVAVFREMRRTLADDGTFWLNIGDSYTSGGRTWRQADKKSPARGMDYRAPTPKGLKPKDLVGVPWRLAFALQADGWYLRSDIIWAKPNPMPESVTDRPTKSHEMIFLFAKSARYYFDSDAVREGVGMAGVVERTNGYDQRLVLGQNGRLERASAYSNAVGVRLASALLDVAGSEQELGLPSFDPQIREKGSHHDGRSRPVSDPVMRRAATEAARFAAGDVSAKEFLGEIDRLCVALTEGHYLKELRTGTRFATPSAVPLIDSDGDAAVAVDDAREVGQFEFGHNQKYTSEPTHRSAHMAGTPRNDGDRWRTVDGGVAARGSGRNIRSVWTIPTQPYPGAHFAVFPPKLVEPCIKAGCPELGTVLDPFAGSGTVGMVAQRLSRRAILIDLNPDYLRQQLERNAAMPLGLSA